MAIFVPPSAAVLTVAGEMAAVTRLRLRERKLSPTGKFLVDNAVLVGIVVVAGIVVLAIVLVMFRPL